MSSPVLFMPWKQWHTVRIIISVETNLFTCHGASPVHLIYELISLMPYVWIVSSEPAKMIPEMGILVLAKIQPYSPFLFDMHISWVSFCSSRILYTELTIIYMSISCPMPHHYVKIFLPVFLSKGKQNPRKFHLYCSSHIDCNSISQWNATCLTSLKALQIVFLEPLMKTSNTGTLFRIILEEQHFIWT